ncbi:MAG: hypothetical protein HC893_09395 [Chloroflexaceae bacterium]|nr:hypothetical protein [Chloroflexaceae bacterium]
MKVTNPYSFRRIIFKVYNFSTYPKLWISSLLKKINLIVSIDTECDKDIHWNIPHPIQYRNTEFGILERLVPLFLRYGIKATYLLSPEVIRHKPSVKVFRSLNNCELGTHLHIEFIEPDRIDEPKDTNGIQAFLSYDKEKEKLANLTQLFTETFGFKPKSFRAGRFGISKHTFTILNDLGYTVDSSITPFKILKFNGYKLNHWGKYPWPYHIRGTQMLQVPVSIINTGYIKLPKLLLIKCSDENKWLKYILNKTRFSRGNSMVEAYAA